MTCMLLDWVAVLCELIFVLRVFVWVSMKCLRVEWVRTAFRKRLHRLFNGLWGDGE